MTANAEARALLDQLMGVERDAPLPSGAALPSYGKRPLDKAGGGMVLPGTKRTKSCYDRDVDPLYCAWGVDIYDLFVNTKSDIGPNPYKADDSARTEYLGLPEDEKQKLGFEHRLFLKLQELVEHCDRTVRRNHEKLKRELQKQSQKRGGNDYVIDVSEEKVEELVRAEIQLEDMTVDLQEALKTLAQVQTKEEKVLEEQRKEQKANEEKPEEETEETNQQSSEQDKDKATTDVKEDSGDAGIVIDRTGESESQDTSEESKDKTSSTSAAVIEELGKLTLQKQDLLCKIATIITQIGPLEESIHVMTLKLNFVRSDTTTDKTVCEVSGNFMSARDADERIAAHYAGKQYVGWKLVRDKFQQMIQKHGRNGPPRPRGGDYGRGDRGGPLQSHQKYMQQGGGGGGGDRYGGGGYNRGRDDRGGRNRYGGDDRGGRWERGGYGDRDRGRYDRYDDRRRGGGYGDRGGYDRRGGSGGYGRR